MHERDKYMAGRFKLRMSYDLGHSTLGTLNELYREDRTTILLTTKICLMCTLRQG